MERVDVIVVGAGIGGSALARSLAAKGRDVLVLERETEYRDKVRGENMPPWGVAEVKALALEEVLLEAGGHYVPRLTPYDDTLAREDAERRTLDLRRLVPDAPGYLDVGHPQACEALAHAAARAGARVVRGVRDVRVRAGAHPQVTFVEDGVERTVACGLIVGADGRGSAVRDQLGLSLTETEPRILAAGLLVHGAREWPDDLVSVGTYADRYFLVCPRADGVARLYVAWSIADRTRFAGPEGPARFLDAFRIPTLPRGEILAAAQPAGPCATNAMNDAYLDEPFVDGAVLIGDAAGWNDPVIGQGLSIALRDARIVRDILLGADLPVSRDALVPYANERTERMRRLRFSAAITTDMRCTFTPDGAARRRRWYDALAADPLIRAAVFAPLLGPERMPAEAFTDEARARTLAL